MKTRFLLILVAVILTAGCATVPQPEVALAPGAINAQTGRIGVGVSKIPELTTQVPGAGCLLCLLAANAANSSLSEYAKTLPYDDLLRLKTEVADMLRKNGAVVTVIEENLNITALPDKDSKELNIAKKNFSSLGQKYGVDKLLVLDIQELGFIRTYATYFPSSDPKSWLKATGYMVNINDNSYDWYQPIVVSKSADGNWDEPPKFPGLTNAYFQGLEMGRDSFLRPFVNSATIAATGVAVIPPVPSTPKEVVTTSP
jgi:hypothetical protein